MAQLGVGEGQKRRCEGGRVPIFLGLTQQFHRLQGVSLFERRRAQLVERLNRGRSNLRTRNERSASDAYTRSLMEHGTETTEREISWLDRLIAGEQPSAPPPHPQEGMTP